MADSPRLQIVQAIRGLCETVRGGAYHVRRGRVNWLKFPFNRYPQAISLMIPEEDLTTEVTKATVSLEFLTQMPDHSQPEIDDRIIDLMREDASAIMNGLVALTVAPSSKDSLFLAVQPLPSLEIADADRGLQGIEQPFIVEY
jgi:hypothetical protein